jgi:hypothetical protein
MLHGKYEVDTKVEYALVKKQSQSIKDYASMSGGILWDLLDFRTATKSMSCYMFSNKSKKRST